MVIQCELKWVLLETSSHLKISSLKITIPKQMFDTYKQPVYPGMHSASSDGGNLQEFVS